MTGVLILALLCALGAIFVSPLIAALGWGYVSDALDLASDIALVAMVFPALYGVGWALTTGTAT